MQKEAVQGEVPNANSSQQFTILSKMFQHFQLMRGNRRSTKKVDNDGKLTSAFSFLIYVIFTRSKSGARRHKQDVLRVSLGELL
jgi:hypothetical protein